MSDTNADFLNPDAPRAPAVLDPLTQRYFNRELSWLGFNRRVVELAEDPTLPLLERVRMLSISGSNLDEFYSVRVAGLKELDRNGIFGKSLDGLSPEEQLEKIGDVTRDLRDAQQRIWIGLQSELTEAGIKLLTREDLSEVMSAYLRRVFLDDIFPILTPLAIDPAHPFPFIPNGGLSLAIQVAETGEKPAVNALLPIPAQVDRFIKLPKADGEPDRVILLEDVLLHNIKEVFPGREVDGHCVFRLLRDGDLDFEEEAEDLVREFETALKRRRRGDVIALSMSANAPKRLRREIIESVNVQDEDVDYPSSLVGIGDVKDLILDNRRDLQWKPFSPRMSERVQDFDGDIFAAVRQKDMLLHHPYETFDTVVAFVQQAARDPDVVAIKQTLYRTSTQSPIVEALCEAAENGKSVTALVELKARFDEAANIRQARRLERSGAHVVYGFVDLKTHAKVSTVVRREGDHLATYTHFGTGNYHPITAKIYTDCSFFTCDKNLGRGATKVFNYVSGYAEPEAMEYLSISPITMKPLLLDMIAKEADNARQGKSAKIWAKMNSLIEQDIIEALYEASQAGVHVELVIRGICGLRPGITGLSENIRVKSIVGRFLEHSRICCFANGEDLPSNKARVFISSADWMDRNLNRRVETLVELTNPTVRAQIVEQIMAANLADTRNSWVLQADGTYKRHISNNPEGLFDCHKFFMENPSLSGRGSAGSQDAPILTHSDHTE
ncbi:MAG: RNA degradosome polyphosphate kinase [Pseudomonadota bacterium]